MSERLPNRLEKKTKTCPLDERMIIPSRHCSDDCCFHTWQRKGEKNEKDSEEKLVLAICSRIYEMCKYYDYQEIEERFASKTKALPETALHKVHYIKAELLAQECDQDAKFSPG